MASKSEQDPPHVIDLFRDSGDRRYCSVCDALRIRRGELGLWNLSLLPKLSLFSRVIENSANWIPVRVLSLGWRLRPAGLLEDLGYEGQVQLVEVSIAPSRIRPAGQRVR